MFCLFFLTKYISVTEAKSCLLLHCSADTYISLVMKLRCNLRFQKLSVTELVYESGATLLIVCQQIEIR